MSDFDQRIAAFRERLEADVEAAFLDGVIGMTVERNGRPPSLAEYARSLRAAGYDVWAGLAESDDGGWEPQLFMRHTFRVPVDRVEITLRVS